MEKFGSIYSIDNGFVVAYERAVALPKHALEAMAERVGQGIARTISGESWKAPPVEPPEVPTEGYILGTAHIYCVDEAGVLDALKRAGVEHKRLLDLQAQGKVHAVGVAHLVNPRQDYLPPFGRLA